MPDELAPLPGDKPCRSKALLVFLAGLALSLLAAGWEHRLEQQAQDRVFFEAAKDLRTSIEAKLLERLHSVRTVANFMTSHPGADQGQFRDFTEPVRQAHPEFATYFWAPRVPAGRRAAFESAMRATQPGYAIHAIDPTLAAMGTDSLPVQLVSRDDLPPDYLGLDLATGRFRGPAVARARDGGGVQLVGCIKLFCLKNFPRGFNIFVPVYRAGLPLATVEERRAAFLGVVGGCIHLDAMFRETVAQLKSSPIDLHIADTGPSPALGFLIHIVGKSGAYLEESDAGHKAHMAGLAQRPHTTLPLGLAGRDWTLTFMAHSGAYQAGWRGALLIALAGAFVSLLAATLFWQWQRNQRRERQFKADLAAREERYRVVAEHSLEWEFWLGPDGRYVYVSPACERISGYPAKAFMADPELDVNIIHPDDRPAFAAHRRYALGGGENQWHELMTFRIMQQSGDERWIEHSCAPIYGQGGRYLGRRGANRDITERKLSELALTEQQGMYRAVFDQAAVGIARVAPNGRWLEVNQRLCDIVGYTREELLATDFQTITHPDDLPADLEYARQLLAGEREYYRMEKRYLHKDGHIVWIRLTGSLVRKEDLSPDYFIGVVEDIAEAKAAEATLRSRLDELQRWQRVTQGREDRVIELKREVNALLRQAGRPDRYPAVEQEGSQA